ncbi:MAG: RagB/SusD family nutrient uptake outer membrane protein [Bacteroidales bacterium]|nr:RagB/SusD family nutrient uptake outer membrane protein [Bacteroidales bacterium]
MKTKYFTGLAAGVLMATAAASCNDFLETHPTTQVSEAEYYKTEYEVQMGLNAVIADVKVRLLEIWAYSSILSDESATGGGLGEGIYKEKFDKFLYNPNNCFGSWGYGSWWNEWDFGIYNGVIDAALLIDKLEDSPLPESFTKPVEAEARFFRALFYSYLFMGYEQFPLIKHYITADEMYNVTKGTRQEIYDFMMEDLADEWIALLPDRGAIVEGRICKDAARVLRAKIALFHRSEADYARCLTDMKTIIGSGVYQLDPDYKHLWLKDGEWGKENIYNVPAGSTNDTGMGFVHGLGGRDLQDPRSAEQGGLCEGYGQNTMPMSIYNMFKDGDTRRDGTVLVYADEAAKVQAMIESGELPANSPAFYVSDQQEEFEGLGHYKYTPRKENTGTVNPASNRSTPFRFYRYADVLLMAVELEARTTGNVGSEGQGYFDQIRDRAFGDTNHRINLSGRGKDAILDLIFEERGYEFIDEMQRWFDILRFDKGVEILGSKGFTEKHRYFPIDQTEMDRAHGKLTQNPGWM